MLADDIGEKIEDIEYIDEIFYKKIIVLTMTAHIEK